MGSDECLDCNVLLICMYVCMYVCIYANSKAEARVLTCHVLESDLHLDHRPLHTHDGICLSQNLTYIHTYIHTYKHIKRLSNSVHTYYTYK